MNYIEKLPGLSKDPANAATNKSSWATTFDTDFATALKNWDKFASPAPGKTGFPCMKKGGPKGEDDKEEDKKEEDKKDEDGKEEDKKGDDSDSDDDEDGKRPECPSVKDADGNITEPGCCAAAIPFKETPLETDWALTNTGRIEVCVIGKDVKTFSPIQFVQVLEDKYSVLCIEGAMKMAAGAAAVMGSIFMMQ